MYKTNFSPTHVTHKTSTDMDRFKKLWPGVFTVTWYQSLGS